MPTSGETSWVLTAGDAIRQAMVELGVLSAGEDPDDSEMNDGIVRLNAMLQSQQLASLMSREATGTLAVPAAAGAATLPASIRDVSGVRHVVNATYHRPLAEWNRSQFYSLPNRAQAGNPTTWTLERGRAGHVLRLWPVPATAVTLHLDYSRMADVVTAPDEEIDLPQEWGEAIIYNLATRLAGMFGASRIDPANLQRVEMRAAQLLTEALDADRPNSYFMEPMDGLPAYGR